MADFAENFKGVAAGELFSSVKFSFDINIFGKSSVCLKKGENKVEIWKDCSRKLCPM